VQSILGLEVVDKEGKPDEAKRSFAKLQLAGRAMELMPQGNIAFAELRQYPLIKNMVPEMGKTEVQTLLVMLITNFCRSFNVVRNMNEDQVIECAMYLLDECRDFTLEDFVIMFTLGKRAQIGEVLDHVDIEVIASMHQEYLRKRMRAFKLLQETERKAQFEAKVAGLGPKDHEAGDKAMQEIKRFTQEWADNIANAEKLEREQRVQKNTVAKNNQIIELIERDAMAGYAPSSQMIEYYLKHIKATTENETQNIS
jgi:hypothetical protein